ncbi:MAG TPA: hypothetical protein VFP61_07605 [Acidimicrobiales bacterium]|nr:hypothetical protein [Acidimicrobiales bacterium]
MQTIASVALAFLGVVVLVNLANGTLRQWLVAKFLHKTSPGNAQPSAKAGSAGGGIVRAA